MSVLLGPPSNFDDGGHNKPFDFDQTDLMKNQFDAHLFRFLEITHQTKWGAKNLGLKPLPVATPIALDESQAKAIVYKYYFNQITIFLRGNPPIWHEGVDDNGTPYYQASIPLSGIDSPDSTLYEIVRINVRFMRYQKNQLVIV